MRRISNIREFSNRCTDKLVNMDADHDDFFMGTLVKLGLIRDELDAIELLMELEDMYGVQYGK